MGFDIATLRGLAADIGAPIPNGDPDATFALANQIEANADAWDGAMDMDQALRVGLFLNLIFEGDAFRIVLVKPAPRGLLRWRTPANGQRSQLFSKRRHRSRLFSAILHLVLYQPKRLLDLGRPELPGMVLSHSALLGCDLTIASFSGVNGLHGL